MRKGYKEKNKKETFFQFLKLVFIITAIIAVIFIIKWYIDLKDNKKIEEKVLEEAIVVETVENDSIKQENYRIDFEKLKSINDETVAWLKVNGTNIENAVVKANDNEYYLNHNFEKKYNTGGWLFADYKNKIDGTDKNIVIYGHNMKDDSMFGTLKNILDKNWYENKENYIIDFITEQKTYKYKVFSIYEIKAEDYYIKTEFTDDEFKKFIQTIKDRSIKDFNIEIEETDTILTLSTCADNVNNRIVLHAKIVN